MTSKTKAILLTSMKWLLIGFLLFVVFYYFWSRHLYGINDKTIVKKLQPFIHQIEKQQIHHWRNQDWCSYFQYQQGIFSKDPKNNGCNIVFGDKNIQAFTPKSQQDFDKLKHQLAITGVKVNRIQAEFDDKSQQPKLTSVTFYINQSFNFNRLYYIYQPNHQITEDGIAGEIWDTPIDANWYRRDEDWN